ncbi:uncharacterized protein LTR77_003055 [Saxophila tyrrhenica]|uniref:Homologous-pairing protein 2 winged helix domain-containing protein n=1 Tax=Saxophila tyrrhenica TaxID=1690608 RepID=A0AAV9PI15_9PEZI|nr:hypothetical protein LTR77_003055 [Saxophila tyrrhenica]
MAPTKKDGEKGEKEAKLTPEQSAAIIMDYLRKQNRPYSATDISSNLKNRVTKAAAAKLLKDMHERNDIEGRAAGKQIVYHVIQEEPDDSLVETLQAMEAETSRLRETTQTLKLEEKQLRASLKDGAACIPLPELKAEVTTLEQQRAEMSMRLQKLQAGSVQPLSAEEREKISSEWKKWSKTAAARKKIRKELWEEILGLIEPSKVAETKEELGLEF